MRSDDREQQLWELEYGLLAEDEATELRAQIAADPELAALQNRVRSRASLVSQAARIESPPIVLHGPAGSGTGSDGSPPRSLPSKKSPVRGGSGRIRRAANWSLGVSLSLLVAVIGWQAWSPTPRDFADRASTAAPAPAVPVVIQVDMPAQWSVEAANPIAVSTMAPDGTGQSAELSIELQDDSGTRHYFDEVQTNAAGQATVELPKLAAVNRYQLRFVPHQNVANELQTEVAVADEEYRTQLSIDKPRYRPGEIVRYRSVTLTRFGLQANREAEVQFVVTDPQGNELAEARASGTTQQGVGSGEFPVSTQAAAGQYTLYARSPSQLFPEAKLDFLVLQPQQRKYDIAVNWTGDAFKAGETAAGKVVVTTPAGEPAADVRLSYRGYVDGREVALATPTAQTSADGVAPLQLTLPSEIASAEGDVGITAEGQETIWIDVPTRPNQVEVAFFPEGGELVAGVENRVYFAARDGELRPVPVRGRIIDSDGKELAAVNTVHAGRGIFRLRPAAGVDYSLVIEDPAGIATRPTLLPARDAGMSLDAGTGVFAADEPVEIRLRSNEPPREFTVVAVCRGVTVGQRQATAAEFQGGECVLQIPLIDQTAGVVRLTVFDYSAGLAEPVAERLVFRRPARKVQLRTTGLRDQYAVGESLRCTVVATDENDAPLSAVLGISVVDDMVLQLAARRAPNLPVQSLLWESLQAPERLEEINAYLEATGEAAAALDLLLGTQGWRRFERASGERLARGRSFVPDAIAARGGFQTRRMPGMAGEGATADATVEETEKDSTAPLGLDALYVEPVTEIPIRVDNRELVFQQAPARGKTTAAGGGAPPVGGADGQTARPPLPTALLALLAAVLLGAALVRFRPTRGMALGVSAAALAGILLWWGMLGLRTSRLPPRVAATSSAPTSSAAAPSAHEPRFGAREVGEEAGRLQPESAPPLADAESKSAAVADPSPPPLSFSRDKTAAVPSDMPEEAPGARPLNRPAATRRSSAAGSAASAETKPAPAPGPAPPATPPLPPPSPASPAARPLDPARPVPAPPTAAAPVPAPAGPPLRKLDAAAAGVEKQSEAKKETAMERAAEGEKAEAATRRAGAPEGRDELPRRTRRELDEKRQQAIQRLEQQLEEKVAADSKRLAQDDQSTSAAGRRARSTSGATRPAEEEGLLQKRVAAGGTTALGGKVELGDAAGTWFRVRPYVHRRTRLPESAPPDFAESVFWHPLVITDSRGEAQVEFDLPDTRTTFRFRVDGHTGGRVGAIEQTLRTGPASD